MLRVGFRKKKVTMREEKIFFILQCLIVCLSKRKKNKVNPEIYKGFKFNVDGILE